MDDASGGPAIVVLAGDRGPADPVAALRECPSKALVPVAGRRMLTRVLDVVAAFDATAPVALVAPDTVEFRAAAADSRLSPSRLRWVAPAESPSRSVVRAFEVLPDRDELLLTTADHPLLEPAWMRQLLEGARMQSAEVAVALVPWPIVAERFPAGRRTRYRFRDVSVCGTNLFVVRSERARRIATIWQRVEADRKRPWRIVSLLGTVNLLRFIGGRLSLEAALAALSRRIGLEVRAVLLDAPESAVDVDTVADLACVEEVLSARAPAHVPD